MEPTLPIFADSWPVRSDFAILGAATFLVFAVYGLILVAYSEPKARLREPEAGTIGPRSFGRLSVRAIVTIVGLVLGFVVLALSGC